MRIVSALFVVSISSYSALSQTYTVSTFAGGGAPVNVAGTSAFFATIQLHGAATDTMGNLFFGYQDSLLRLDATSGVVRRVAGTGSPGFSGDQGPAALAQFSLVAGVALDSAGNLYVSDYYNNRVRKISKGIVSTIAGDGTLGFSGDGGPAANARLNRPSGIALDAAGNLYIADTANARVRKVSNGVIMTVAGNGTAGFGGDNGSATNAQFNGFGGIALDSAGNLYIADTLNGRIRKVSNGVITTFAGTGSGNSGSTDGDNGPATSAFLAFPVGVATDGAANVYISVGNKIRKVANGVITTLAGTEDPGFNGDGPALRTQLNNAQAMSVDSAGNLYFVDVQNYRIRKVANGTVKTVAGTGGNGFNGANGPALNAEFSIPQDIVAVPGGAVYLTADYRILKISNGVVTRWQGTERQASVATMGRRRSPN